MPPPDEQTVAIRPLRTADEYDRCVALQRATWGDDFRELVAPAMLKVAQEVGGIAAGAFDADGTLAGFVFGLTGLRGGRLAHWSHMLAVREDRRDRGIGRRLKRYQRERLRALGVERMYWTYDPLVARNAHLNLNALGARVVDYVEHMYGENPMSRTDSVIGTDRFVVEWPVAAPVEDAAPPPLPAGADEAPLATADVARDVAAPQPDLPDAPLVRVEIPEDIQALKLARPDVAAAWRATTRRALTHYLRRGYRVAGLRRAGARCHYVVRAADA